MGNEIDGISVSQLVQLLVSHMAIGVVDLVEVVNNGFTPPSQTASKM
ncbi:uncharacterized protein METZ01_LOCUS331680, partial [marine metagenome]